MSRAPAFDPDVAAPVCVALSGGMDSTALLHALAASVDHRNRGLRALHVHHGLQAQADAWAAHCAQTCEALDIPFDVAHVDARDHAGRGREAAARDARYAAFEQHLREGEALALAHHRDDQAETVLLRALRGSGVDGLAAMHALRPLGRGRLWRPWLAVPRADIAAFARAGGLRWVEDPSNQDASLDRNHLRQHVLPLLRRQWPGCDAALAAVALQAREARTLLDDADAALLGPLLDGAGTLSADGLRAQPAARRRRLLRRWVASRGLPALPGAGVAAVESWLASARGDAQPCFDWAGTRLRLWRARLHAGPMLPPLPAGLDLSWDGSAPLALPDGGELAFSPALRIHGMRVHARRGGERILLPARAHRHALKHVLQDTGMPPWERERLPLLSAADGELLAAGDRIVSARLHALLADRGVALCWRRPRTASGD